MYGAAQVMDDLRRESMELEAGTHLDDLDARCAYPFNWIPQHARKPQREALIGLHNILLVIYAIMEQGNIPDIETINELCAKESDSLQHVTDYIECGGSVENVLSELTSQIESDIKGEALNVDGEDLQEALQQIAPCALDDRTEYWRKAVGIA
ncbi:hypothetical protein IWQ57_001222 [Coemansia nantahalensis]|uniref:Uncharacterized protein n=2 Tax=Coemansia TaxID=4863 RepID=A0ACC1LBG9_9FUNG|nr:hypothetical protein IWQ57_001222 [Coemansia nantahalensis]KAJ2804682.1 hypothetical protein H4R21_001547 [Coemansia helicoidea]